MGRRLPLLCVFGLLALTGAFAASASADGTPGLPGTTAPLPVPPPPPVTPTVSTPTPPAPTTTATITTPVVTATVSVPAPPSPKVPTVHAPPPASSVVATATSAAAHVEAATVTTASAAARAVTDTPTAVVTSTRAVTTSIAAPATHLAGPGTAAGAVAVVKRAHVERKPRATPPHSITSVPVLEATVTPVVDAAARRAAAAEEPFATAAPASADSSSSTTPRLAALVALAALAAAAIARSAGALAQWSAAAGGALPQFSIIPCRPGSAESATRAVQPLGGSGPRPVTETAHPSSPHVDHGGGGNAPSETTGVLGGVRADAESMVAETGAHTLELVLLALVGAASAFLAFVRARVGRLQIR